MKAEDLLRRQEQLAGARATWESHWQEVADYVPLSAVLSGETFLARRGATVPGADEE